MRRTQTKPRRANLSADALTVLVANHRRFLAFLKRRVGSRAQAEDILQAALLKSLESRARVRDEGSVVAWFYRVLRNAVIDHYRAAAAEQRALEAAAPPVVAEPGFAAELERAVCTCVLEELATLRPAYGRLLRRVDVEGRSIRDVAKELGIPANNARVRLHRARRALRDRLRLTCRTCADHGCLDCTCSRGRASGPASGGNTRV